MRPTLQSLPLIQPNDSRSSSKMSSSCAATYRPRHGASWQRCGEAPTRLFREGSGLAFGNYRRLARQSESVPVLDTLRVWLDDTINKVPQSTVLGKARAYQHNQSEVLARFRDKGRYGSDTNPLENAIRPLCVGRRNWLFCDAVARVHTSDRLYSPIECAKANGLEPYAYVRHVFTELPRAKSIAQVGALLPTRLEPAGLARDSLQGSFSPACQ